MKIKLILSFQYFRVTDGDFTVTSEKLTINVLDVNDNKPSITAIEDITKPETLAVGKGSDLNDHKLLFRHKSYNDISEINRIFEIKVRVISIFIYKALRYENALFIFGYALFEMTMKTHI
jgi:hypothetical protein